MQARADWRRHPILWSWRDVFAHARARSHVGSHSASLALQWLAQEITP